MAPAPSLAGADSANCLGSHVQDEGVQSAMTLQRSLDHTPGSVTGADVSDQAAVPIQVYRQIDHPPATPFTGRLGSSDTDLENARSISALRRLRPRKCHEFETDLGDIAVR